MPLYDFECTACAHTDEVICSTGRDHIKCPKCGKRMSPVWAKAPSILTTIIPSYPGCKRQKAGYVHTHGDRPAEKVQGRGWEAP